MMDMLLPRQWQTSCHPRSARAAVKKTTLKIAF